jgi:hypothetical protein
MIEPRIYRAAFVPAVLAIVLTMFSLQSRPRPLPQGLAADVLFDGRQALAGALDLVELAPDRRPGSSGDRLAAARVATALARRGFVVKRDRFSYADRSLENVIGRRAGASRRQLVVLAARDADGVPDVAGSAADTAALLELARVFAGRPTRKTLVLASVDGATLGDVGAQRFAKTLGGAGPVEAVVVMSDLGADTARGPLVQAWSNDSRRAGIGLQRTLADSIRKELDEPVGGTGALGQLARLSFPLGIGAQGVLLEEGFEAVRISGSGALPRTAADGPQDVDEDRLGALGRATLRTVTALDQARTPPRHGPDTYLTVVSQVLPGWVLQLLAGTLLLPVLIASVDAFARARRRQVSVTPWLRWVAAWTVPFVAGLALAELLVLVGATPQPPPAPVAPALLPLDGAAVAVLAAVAVAMVLAWLAARRLARWPDPGLDDPGVAPGAGVALMLVVSAAALLLWLLNPYAALLAVPAVHLWLLACLTDPPLPRRWRLVFVAAGGVAPAIVAVYYLIALHLDPLSGAWYLLMLVTGHHVGLLVTLVAGTLLGAGLAAAELARGAHPEAAPGPPDDRPPVYGPGGLAGPGSLGGTESALPR